MGRVFKGQWVVHPAALVLVLVVNLLATPPDAEAQQAAEIPRVGFVEAGSRSANQHFVDAFRAGLHELGYVEGQNIRVEERWAEGRIERFPDLLADLLRLKVAVIVRASSSGAVTAKKVATTVPGVFVGANDPVGLGLVESLARPGGNLTGLSLASHGAELHAATDHGLALLAPGR